MMMKATHPELDWNQSPNRSDLNLALSGNRDPKPQPAQQPSVKRQFTGPRKRFRKIYVEISNLCNLRCRFCPGTRRPPHAMTEAEFSALLPKLQPWTDYLYFHLMGEPLLHPQLERFLELAGQAGFHVILTTNGVLLPERQAMLLSAPALHKINISLHAFEANDLTLPFDVYVKGCLEFAQAAEGRKLVCLRLWNEGGEQTQNETILAYIRTMFPSKWRAGRRGTQIGRGVYVESGDRFDWPDLTAEAGDRHMFCYGLRDQLGVLCDGTVVPCCLDHEGDLALGNLADSGLDEILASTRAQAIYRGFSEGQAVEALCRRCGYARRFR